MTDCVFCRIIHKELPSTPVFEDEEVLVIPDLHPKAPVHILAISKQHIESLAETTDANTHLLGRILAVLREQAVQLGIGKSGYKIVINSGKDGGQSVPHLHAHLLGGKNLNSIT